MSLKFSDYNNYLQITLSDVWCKVFIEWIEVIAIRKQSRKYCNIKNILFKCKWKQFYFLNIFWSRKKRWGKGKENAILSKFGLNFTNILWFMNTFFRNQSVNFYMPTSNKQVFFKEVFIIIKNVFIRQAIGANLSI